MVPRAGGRREGDPPENVHDLLVRYDAHDTAVADRLIDVAVVARRLDVSGTTVRNWIQAGRMRAVITPTGRYRVPLAELARVLKTQDPQPT